MNNIHLYQGPDIFVKKDDLLQLYDILALKKEHNLRSPSFFAVFLQSHASQWYASLPVFWNK